MKSNPVLRILALVFALLFTMSLAACGQSAQPTASPSAAATVAPATAAPSSAEAASAAPAAPVTLKMMSVYPDRTSGIGKLEQTLIDSYTKTHPNVTITVEALADAAYSPKFKAYEASNSLPDIYFVWGFPAQFMPIAAGGYAAELNPQDFADDGFFPGVFDAYTYNGKLYALPESVDITCLYYNKKIFADNNVKVPTTFQELIEASKALRAKGIAPCAQNGKEKWCLSIIYDDLVLKRTGDQSLMYNALNMKTDFATQPEFLQAAEDFKQLVDAGFFQDSFTSADYGAARNLFGQGKAAMFYMGSWEGGLAIDPNFTDDFKKNLGVMAFPAISGTNGKSTDLLGWSSGFAVSANSKNKDVAIDVMKYWFKPENHTKLFWEGGLGIPAQKYDSYITGNETDVYKQLTAILSGSTSMSICAWNDYLTPAFKDDIQTATQELAVGIKTPQQFVEAAGQIIAKDQK